MANAVTALASYFVTPVTYFVNSENASYPGSNAISVSTPNNPYRSANAPTTSEFLTYDFGTTVSLAAVVIDHTNILSVRIKGNAANSGWGSPTYNSGAISPLQDGKDGRYKLYLSVQGAFTALRYLRLECATTVTTDGASTWRVGCLLALSTFDAWTQNFEFPYTPTNSQAIAPGTKTGGGAEPSALGNRNAVITLPTSNFDDTAMEGIIDGILGQRAKPLMFYRNFGNAGEVYLGTVTNVVTGPARVSPKRLQVSQIVITEFA